MLPFFLPFIHALPGMQSEGIVFWNGQLSSSERKAQLPPQEEVPRLRTGWVMMGTRGTVPLNLSGISGR